MVMLRNENGCGCGGNNTPADGWHACVSSLRLVWNYDDTQGAGILFSVFLIRKQQQAEGRRECVDNVFALTEPALCVADNHIQFTPVDAIMLQPAAVAQDEFNCMYGGESKSRCTDFVSGQDKFWVCKGFQIWNII